MNTIQNIRYGPLGKILFDVEDDRSEPGWCIRTFTIKEPKDVLLVDTGNDAAATKWIRARYGYLIDA